MNNLEASLEILKLIVEKESFKGLSISEKTNQIMESFQIIYKQLLETTAEINLQEDILNRKEAPTAGGGAGEPVVGPKPSNPNTRKARVTSTSFSKSDASGGNEGETVVDSKSGNPAEGNEGDTGTDKSKS